MQQAELVALLKKECNKRTKEDVKSLLSYLQGLDCFSPLPDAALERLCQVVRYEEHKAGTVLYHVGGNADCWYILIKGNVFIDGIMFVPPSSFGKRVKGSTLRQADCIVLDDSEFIVIDYWSVCHEGMAQEVQQKDAMSSIVESDTIREDGEEFLKPRNDRWIIHRSLDSGDLCVSTEIPNQFAKYDAKSLIQNEESNDFLKETSVDSDVDDSSIESFSPVAVKDAVKDCLDKLPKDRTEDDIEVILDFMQHFPAFCNMTLALRRAMCAVVAYAFIESANTVIYTDGQEFDSWSIIINGEVEISRSDESVSQLLVGDSFGLRADVGQRSGALHHSGVMFTKVDNCQFVCVAKEDFYKTLHQGVENTEKVEEHGKIVLVTEKRPMKKGNKTGIVVIRGTPEKLISHLVEEQSSADSSYAEDFLLTSRTFLKFPMELAEQLLAWLGSEVPAVRDKAVRVTLLWVNNHFSDFEFVPSLNDFLAKFENFLTSQAMEGQLKLLSIACSVKSHQRRVVLSRVDISEEWPFSIFSLSDTPGVIFVQSIRQDSCESGNGMLLRGDQILLVNDRCLESMSFQQILDLLKFAVKLDLTVRFNIEAFREAVKTPSPISSTDYSKTGSGWCRGYHGNEEMAHGEIKGSGVSGRRLGDAYLSPKFIKDIQPLSRNIFSHKPTYSSDFTVELSDHHSVTGRTLHSSGSHPDLTFVGTNNGSGGGTDQLIKIHGPNQAFKKLLINKEMTVAEVVAMAAKEFGLQTPSRYCLCQESVDDKNETKLTVLHGRITNIPGTSRPNSKFYLISRPSSVDVPLHSIITESSLLDRGQSSFLQLQPEELAKQLTSRDLFVFKDIESTEYIVDLFNLPSNYGAPNLNKFTKLMNDEMFWVITEICSEGNTDNRAKLIQKFVKIAKFCKEASNLNSMFFIVSGLSHGAISRLKLTWERVPTKYSKLFKSLQELLDPSRNMSNYRNLLKSELSHTPAIPFFPILKKDLAFIHFGNDSKVEGLINFEKLRMVAKEVRQVTGMASSYYHRFSKQNLSEQPSSTATFNGALASSVGSTSGASVFATLRKKKPLPTRLNSRKLLDEVHMVHRIKDYLSSLQIIDDEERLIRMSNQLEPSANPKRKPVSPLPPVTYNAAISNAEAKQNASGPKFGTSSTQAVQKLMSLTDKVKPHDQRKHPVPSVPPPPDFKSRSAQPKPLLQAPIHLSVESSSIALLGFGFTNQNRAPSTTHGGDETDLGVGSHLRQSSQPSHAVGSTSSSFPDAGGDGGAGGVGALKNSHNFAQADRMPRLKKVANANLGRDGVSDGDPCIMGCSSSAPVSPCHTFHGTLSLQTMNQSRGTADDSVLNIKTMAQKLRKAGVQDSDCDLSDEELLVSVV